MRRKPSRSALAALGVAALLVTTGCLSAVGGPGAATDAGTQTGAPTDEPTATPDEQSADTPATDGDDSTPTESPTASPTATPADTATGPDSAAALEAAFESKMTSLDSLTATRSQTTSLEDRTQTTTTAMWVRFDTGEYRTEMVAPDARAGNLVVGTTDTVWTYLEQQNTVTKVDRDRSNAANATTTTTVRSLATDYDLTEYEPVTRDGQETYRATFVPERDAGVDVSVTAWLDAETYFPATIEQSYELENRTLSTTSEYENVTLNATIPDERFAFEPPADATVETLDLPETESFDSLESMRASVNASVPAADVPGEYAFERGQVVPSENTTLSVRYSNGTDAISVSKIGTTFPLQGGENVSVGDRDGQLRSYGETSTVTWACDGWTYSVSGSLDRAALLDVATSVDCG